jgi:hypothetical protein
VDGDRERPAEPDERQRPAADQGRNEPAADQQRHGHDDEGRQHEHGRAGARKDAHARRENRRDEVNPASRALAGADAHQREKTQQQGRIAEPDRVVGAVADALGMEQQLLAAGHQGGEHRAGKREVGNEHRIGWPGGASIERDEGAIEQQHAKIERVDDVPGVAGR